jgi:hypothetical protein
MKTVLVLLLAAVPAVANALPVGPRPIEPAPLVATASQRGTLWPPLVLKPPGAPGPARPMPTSPSQTTRTSEPSFKLNQGGRLAPVFNGTSGRGSLSPKFNAVARPGKQ